MNKTIYAKLVAVNSDQYTVYVFQDLSTKEYIMCTKLPNWGGPDVEINDEGFLTVKYVTAGENYFEVASQQDKRYLYSNIYFENFVNKPIEKNNTEVIL